MHVLLYSKSSLVHIDILAVIFFLFRLMEEAYVMKDPFSEERGFITLGSSCNICRAEVCLSQVLKIMQYKRNCSLYYHDDFRFLLHNINIHVHVVTCTSLDI